MAQSRNVETPTLGDFRLFVQEDGPSPFNPYFYFGDSSLGGVTKSLGDDTPFYLPSRTQRNKWDIVGVSRSTPGLPTTDFTARSNKYLDDAWTKLSNTGCYVNMQIVIGDCTRPDDFLSWTAKYLLPLGRPTSITTPEVNILAGDNNGPAEITGSITLRDLIVIRQLRFEEQADATIITEVLDGIYNDAIDCGNCGTPSDGCQRAYVLAAADTGSPGLSAHIIYTTNGWATESSVDISSLGGLSGNRLAAVGNYLVVVSEADGAHHFIRFSELSDSSAWQRVATGYEAGGSPRCIESVNSQEVFIGGAGGFIYKLTAAAAGVTPLTDGSLSTANVNDIRTAGNVVAAACDSNIILLSINRGQTFVSLTGPEPGQNLNTIELTDSYTIYVGTGNGNLYASNDQGETWTQLTTDNLDVINRIRFYDKDVGFMAAQVGSTGRVYATDDVGNTWINNKPRLSGLPTAERYNFVTACDYNAILTGGRQSAEGDGILALAR